MDVLNRFKHIQIFIILSFFGICTTNNNTIAEPGRKEKCVTARSEPGECIEIEKCSKLIAIVKEAKTNNDTKVYLTNSVCEYVDKKPIICCPFDGPVDLDNSENVKDYTFLSPPNCGTAKHIEGSRIVGGRPSLLGEWPWEVALAYKSKLTKRTVIFYRCGGTIVSNQFVLTAAHCGTDQNLILFQVRMGVVNLGSNKNSDPPAIDINIFAFIPHKDYDSKAKYNNDIALIKLAERVEFTKYIQPICLPKTADYIFNNFVDETAFVAGWGTLGFRMKTSNEQMEIEVDIFNNSVCSNAYTKFGIRLTNRHLCAGDLKGERDSCQGDSGGPLMKKKNGVSYVLGVVSFGYRCAEVGYPGIYTRVASYLDWISLNLK